MKTFQELYDRGLQLARSHEPDWDLSKAHFGNILLSAVCQALAEISQDAQDEIDEYRAPKKRKTAIDLGKLFDYKLHGAKAARATEVFKLNKPAEADVIIPEGTVVKTRQITEPLRFQLLEDVAISKGERESVGIVEHSESHEMLFDASGLEYTDLELEHLPYLDDSISVLASNGVFEERENLLQSTPEDRHFSVVVDTEDRATIRFGNGASGVIPTGTIRVNYKTGGGTVGNVDPHSLTVIEGTFVDVEGRVLTLMAHNPERAYGGKDRQGVEDAIEQMPKTFRVRNRTVAREDFEASALEVETGGKALMLTSDQDGSIGENRGIVFVVPKEGGEPSEGLKQSVLDAITKARPHTLTFEPVIQGANYLPVSVEVRLYIRKDYDKNTVRDNIRDQLESFFSVPKMEFGYYLERGEIPISKISKTILDVEGVDKISDHPNALLLNGLASDLTVGLYEFPTLENVVLIDGDTGRFL